MGFCEVEVETEGIKISDCVGPSGVEAGALAGVEGASHGSAEPRAHNIIEDGESKRAAGAEKAVLREAEEEMEAVRAALEFGGEQFVPIQKLENGVSKTEGIAEPAVPAGERDPLLADLIEPDENIRRGHVVVRDDLDVFVLDM